MADTEYYYKRIEEAIAELKSNMAKWLSRDIQLMAMRKGTAKV